MTRIDFYVLDDGGGDARLRLACRLAEKAFRQGHSVYVHADSDVLVQQLDELLWTFRDESFLPHEINRGPDTYPAPIQIGNVDDPQVDPDMLINLAADVPSFFGRFKRMAELVDADPDVRTASRERFRYYKERGYPLQTHRVP